MSERDFLANVRELAVRDRIWKYTVVGVLGAICDYTVLISLFEYMGVPLEVAKVVGAETAIIGMFIVNEQWTFAGWGNEGWRALIRRLAKSNVVRIGGVITAVVTLSLLVRLFNVPYMFANAAGICAGFVINYLAENLVTWRVHQPKSRH